jgi:6-phosphogluconolactonase (cycloisomerase 2 family)
MARHTLAALLMAGAAAASNLLYVASYAGTITTLDMSATMPSGGNVPAMKAIATNQGCTTSPSWLTLDHDKAVLYCVDEGLSTPGGSLSSYRTNCDGSLTQLDKITTTGGPVSAVIYGSNGHGLAMAH